MAYFTKQPVRRALAAASVTIMILCSGAQAAVLQPSSPHEQAQFLAGIPLGKGSILHQLQKSPAYRQHQKELQEQWLFCRRIRYGAMQQWAREYLARYPATRGVLRYLFGGPDFLNAFAFFPDTRIMVLGGLEPVGEVPPPEALDPTSLGTALKALEEALHTSLFCGYFITSEMKPQLAQGSFRGVLPVLYAELALTGNIIDSVSMLRPFGSPGVEIIYHRQGGTPQTLCYFQADLSNGKECRRFLSWLSDLGPGASYLKAASYLLPLDSFSETRNFLTRTSSLILQDDSGLPFRSLLPGEWQIQLFGIYSDPLPIFKLGRDPSLEEAYRSAMRVGPIPFGAGYHVQPEDANLMLAVRLQSAGLFSGEIPQTAPPQPVLPSFAAPIPKSKPIRIRKALPVPIKKAIAIQTPKPTPLPTPQQAPSPLPETTVASPPEKILDPPLQTSSLIPPSPQPAATQATAAPEAQPTPVSTTTPSPETKSPADAMPSSTPSETPHPSPAETPQAAPQATPEATPEASPEPAAPAPAEETTN